jgi:acyl-coenzyme A synthetase/AMP-(fatty) acid ligase
MSNPDIPATELMTVTERLVTLAAGHYKLRALVGGVGPDGRAGMATYSYCRFAATVLAAASGLAWRGLQPKDVVGVYVPDAVSFVLAMHTVRAAGGIPCPVAPGLAVTEMAGQLADAGARMLITSPPLADAALAAADRSWVRQAFSFAEAAGTTPFTDLLGRAICQPVPSSRPDDTALLPFSRGDDGRLRPAPVSHLELAREMAAVDERTEFTKRDVVIATPPSGDGLHYTVLLDTALLRGATVVASAANELGAQVTARHGTAAVVPDGAGVRFRAPFRVFAAA